VTPEYPGAHAFIQARGFHFDPGRKVQRIVIHCTDGGPSANRTAAYFASGAEGKSSSAHFVIGQDATVIQCVRLGDVAHHAHTANRDSIGIEHCCRTPRELGPGDAGLPPSAAQLAASARLVAWLCNRLGIPCDRAHVRVHAEADPDTTHKGCPTSAGINLDALVAAAQQVDLTQPICA